MKVLPCLAGGFLTLAMACAAKQNAPAQDGKAVVDAYVRAWNNHDSAALDTILAPDAVHEDIAETFRGAGPKAVVGFMRSVISAEPDYKWTITNSIMDGKIVAIEWTWTASYTGPDPRGKQVTNRHTSGRGASLAHVENGKIRRFTDYYDQASFFR
jgi:steroid delta-isomerase-like uncharacterized protein